jgi:hypothetical protein
LIRSAAELQDAQPLVRQGGSLAAALLHGTLFLAILVSPLVFYEPSPYEAVCGLLALAAVAARVPFSRKLLPLLVLLLILNVGGLLTLMLPRDESTATDALIYMAVSLYLSMTAVVFACIFSQDTERRMVILRRAYIIAAFIAALIGIAGYFGLYPDATLYGRARATFKDPNVFGPFLILPLILLLQTIISPAVRLRHLFVFSAITFGLLLSFSRGAWAHFLLSAGIAVAMTFLTAPDIRTRFRLIALSAVAAAGLVVFVAGALSVGPLAEMFEQRAKLTQSYDVGTGGRFGLQERALDAVLQHPAGMGPFEFSRVYGGQQHNVYFQAFLNYGWAGGFAYLLLIVLTLFLGFRHSLVATPWQPYLIAAFATFVGAAAEGFVIDTDHWRHFFLLLGIIWGLSAATSNAKVADARRIT